MFGNDPRITYPEKGYGPVFDELGSMAIMIFDTKSSATAYKKFCQGEFPNQKHRVVKAAFAMDSALTDIERREIDAKVRRRGGR